ncbi:MAG: NUDIX hydrolase [Bacteroidales bacterium]
MENDWKKIEKKIVHKNPWYQLRGDIVQKPNGSIGDYYFVDGLNSSAVIAIDDHKNIYLVGQNRYPIGNRYSWEIIIGGVENNSEFLSAAKRELLEEAGLIAETWIDLGDLHPSNGYSSEKCKIFFANNIKMTVAQPEDTEKISIRKVKINKILQMINDGEITCGITIASIFKLLINNNSIKTE